GLLCVEASVVVDEHRRPSVPWGKEAAPGMFGPAGGGNVEVYIAFLEAEHVHARQVADRVALVGVHDQLGSGGRPGGEIEQKRIRGGRRAFRGEAGRGGEGVLVCVPARDLPADREAYVATRLAVKLVRAGVVGDDEPDAATREAVGQLVTGQGGTRRRHD